MNEDVEILIVEDSSTQAEDLKHILLKNNYNVTIACNGRAALEIVPKKHPSLIISDIVMPEMNGYELCKTLKSEESTKSIPIILLTSLSDPIDVVNGLKCKADNFITKPYTEEFLISRIHHILINLEMRKNKISELNIDVYFAGEMHTFNSERIQIIDLLLSTFENAIQKTQELQESNNELKKAIATIKKLEKNYRNILESNLDALIVIDKENLISYVNPSAEELLHKERKELLGMPLPFDTKNDYKELKIGEDTIVEMRISDIIWENEEATLLSLRNVTERVHLRERLKMQSLTDELTGLYNRRGFIKLAESSISRANRKKTGMILFFIDMDKMKYINDNYGHNEGDEAIVAASSILRETFRNSDVIGRIGGDEFAVISTEAEANNIKTIENRLKSVQDKYNDNSEHKYKISLSVGGVYYNPEEPYTIDEWMIKADQLMYENKKKKIE